MNQIVLNIIIVHADDADLDIREVRRVLNIFIVHADDADLDVREERRVRQSYCASSLCLLTTRTLTDARHVEYTK